MECFSYLQAMTILVMGVIVGIAIGRLMASAVARKEEP